MIPIKCPHCAVGLKIDETKIPAHLTSFKCPKCKAQIPVSLIHACQATEESETVLVQPGREVLGSLLIHENPDTPQQEILLYEGSQIIGRKSNADASTSGIQTTDRSMSRAHILIEVKKDAKGYYKHYLSDNNSKNNTLFNNKYLDKQEVVVLQDGDEIVIGHTLIRFNA